MNGLVAAAIGLVALTVAAAAAIGAIAFLGAIGIGAWQWLCPSLPHKVCPAGFDFPTQLIVGFGVITGAATLTWLGVMLWTLLVAIGTTALDKAGVQGYRAEKG